jgi:type 1 glutamine amidotransferase
MRTLWRILKWILIALSAIVIGLAIWIGPQAYSALHPSREHDKVVPAVPASFPNPAVLVFSKTNGFRHDEAIAAAGPMFRELAARQGWSVYQTENGAVFSSDILSRFKVVVFSNASGDMLASDQRAALQRWIEAGGGFVGIHAAGDDSHKDWVWYYSQVIGSKFVGHSLWPHLAMATIRVEAADHPVMAGLPAVWNREDEWYSFDKSVRGKQGFRVLATLDEATYERGGPGSAKLSMGKDHPIVWSHCQAKGRVIYSALGHTGESYAEAPFRTLVTNAVTWAMRSEPCDPAKGD